MPFKRNGRDVLEYWEIPSTPPELFKEYLARRILGGDTIVYSRYTEGIYHFIKHNLGNSNPKKRPYILVEGREIFEQFNDLKLLDVKKAHGIEIVKCEDGGWGAIAQIWIKDLLYCVNKNVEKVMEITYEWIESKAEDNN